MIENPIFLVGSERSGSTLLRLMLDSHPDIAFIEEFEYAFELIEDGREPDINKLYDHLRLNRIFQTSGFKIDKTLSYRELINNFLETRQKAKRAQEVGATVHYGFKETKVFWPGAKYIRIVRDPRDVAPSIMRMGWEHNVWHALDKWIDSEEEWEALEPQLSDGQYITVRFEDLVHSPENELLKICKFLDVKFTKDMFNYAKDTDYALPSPSESKTWKQSLTVKQVQTIEFRVGKMLTERGFALSGFEPIELSKRQILILRLENKIFGHKYRIKRYGFLIYVQDLFSRKLNIKPWQTKAADKINAIEQTYLKKSWRSESIDHKTAR